MMMRSSNRRFRFWLLAAGAGLAALWLVAGCGHKQPEQSEEPAPIGVQTVTARLVSIPDQWWSSGTVAPYASAEIAPRIMSTVKAIYVREGDRVRAGQILARLEADDLAAQAASARSAAASAESVREKAQTAVGLQSARTRADIINAEAEMKSARQQLSALREGPRRQEKAQARLMVTQAEAQFKNAEVELARMTRLHQDGVIPRQRLESVQTQYAVASAQLGVAKSRAEMSEEGGRSQDVIVAEERVRQAEASLRLARVSAARDEIARREAKASAQMASQARAGERAAGVMLGYATIVAPFSGVVTGRYVDPGDTASPGTPILSVQDQSRYRLDAAVPTGAAAGLRVGATVEVELGAGKTQGRGRIALVVPSGDPGSRKSIVKIDIPSSLRPVSGDFGRVAFTKSYGKGILLPVSALRDQGGIVNVFVAGPNKRADMRIVRVGREIGDMAEIITGVSPGEAVVVRSEAPLEDDVLVGVKESIR